MSKEGPAPRETIIFIRNFGFPKHDTSAEMRVQTHIIMENDLKGSVDWDNL